MNRDSGFTRWFAQVALMGSFPWFMSLAGCGTGTYSEQFDRRLEELKVTSAYAALAKATEDLPVNFRAPLSMVDPKDVYNLYSADPVENSKYVNRSRALPPFMQDGIGYRMTFEGKYVQNASNSTPYFLYVWMFDAPSTKDGLILLRDHLRRMLNDPKADWESVDVPTPQGKTLSWKRLHFKANQVFEVERNRQVEDNTESGIFELWYFDAPCCDVLFGWRATEEAWDKATSGDAKLSELPQIVAGTITFKEDEPRSKHRVPPDRTWAVGPVSAAKIVPGNQGTTPDNAAPQNNSAPQNNPTPPTGAGAQTNAAPVYVGTSAEWQGHPYTMSPPPGFTQLGQEPVLTFTQAGATPGTLPEIIAFSRREPGGADSNSVFRQTENDASQRFQEYQMGPNGSTRVGEMHGETREITAKESGLPRKVILNMQRKGGELIVFEGIFNEENYKSLRPMFDQFVTTFREDSATSSATPPVGAAQTRITIARDTTYITQPLRADGYVDYMAALNERSRQGVTPESNAVVATWNIAGSAKIPPGIRERYFKMLGVPPVAEQGDFFLEIDDFVNKQAAAGAKVTHDEMMSQIDTAVKRPWSRNEFPNLAAWVDANESLLKKVIDAAALPRFYEPVIAADESGALVTAPIPCVEEMRGFVQALTVRATLRLNEKDVTSAWIDLFACHRLARLTGQSPFSVAAIVARAVDGIAISGDGALLISGSVTASDASRIRNDLEGLPPFSKMVDAIDVGDRFMLLDTVETILGNSPIPNPQTRDPNGSNPSPGEVLKVLKPLSLNPNTDWNVVLRLGNSEMDKAMEALRKPSYLDRAHSASDIGKDIKQRVQAWQAGNPMAALREGRSDGIASLTVEMLLPPLVAENAVDGKAAMRLDLVRVGLAIAAFRAENGSFPTALSDLAPKYIANVPGDLFNGKELVFKPAPNECVLYSVGVNGEDDGGNSDDGDGGKRDDLVVKVAAFKGASQSPIAARDPSTPDPSAPGPRRPSRGRAGPAGVAADPSAPTTPAAAAPAANPAAGVGPQPAAGPAEKQGPVSIEFQDKITATVTFPPGFQNNGKSPDASTTPPMPADPAAGVQTPDTIKIQAVKLGQGNNFTDLRREAINSETQGGNAKIIERGSCTIAGASGDFVVIWGANSTSGNNDAPRRRIVYLANVTTKRIAVKVTADIADSHYKTLKEEILKSLRTLKFD